MMELLWIDLADSLWHDWKGDGHAEDRLESREWQAAFLERNRLSAPVPASEEEVAELRRFRDELRGFSVRLAAGEAATEDMVHAINDQLAEQAVVRRAELEEGGSVRLSWTPAADSWRSVRAEAAADFARSLAEGLGSRIRLCDNGNCKWVFLDDTRNRSKRFCDDKLCGNLMKVRRFRERKKTET
ncbi:CGNR zinc finger domain-containing protein [Paenibacillus sp. LHD-117]|uniref:CGNR zinc finger domain-containing protein n=1 Tax=Paenibacillus sp. LHD-117 TaxID=3071412 RepID=UPI0027DF7305|nr:CGNR zinc finger domain-containing protein [Paenibacillus sp. LHD-117]MDQ6421512.1 CGNR zinc finger domain-containing protein [Paenibacillus sp. LHD-117]